MTGRHKRSLHTNFWFVEDFFCVDILDGCETIPISLGKHHQLTDSNELDFGFDNVPLFTMRKTVRWRQAEVRNAHTHRENGEMEKVKRDGDERERLRLKLRKENMHMVIQKMEMGRKVSITSSPFYLNPNKT